MLDDLAIGDIAFVNHRRCRPGWRLDGRRAPGWHVLALAISGRADYVVDGQRLALSAGDTLLLPPDCQRHAGTDPLRPWVFASAGFRLGGTLGLLPYRSHPGTAPAVRLFAEAMIAWDGGQGLLVRARLSELLHLHLAGYPQRDGDPRLARVLADLDRHPIRARVSETALAKQAGLSVSRFRVLFRATAGMPLHRYLTRRRLSQARALLLSGSSVAAAAAAVGYDDQHHFSRLFRQHVGMPPSACIQL